MLIVSDLINNGIEIIESLKKRNKDFSKEISLIIDLDKKALRIATMIFFLVYLKLWKQKNLTIPIPLESYLISFHLRIILNYLKNFLFGLPPIKID